MRSFSLVRGARNPTASHSNEKHEFDSSLYCNNRNRAWLMCSFYCFSTHPGKRTAVILRDIISRWFNGSLQNVTTWRSKQNEHKHKMINLTTKFDIQKQPRLNVVIKFGQLYKHWFQLNSRLFCIKWFHTFIFYICIHFYINIMCQA